MVSRRSKSRTPGTILVGRTVEVRIERIVSGGYGQARRFRRGGIRRAKASLVATEAT